MTLFKGDPKMKNHAIIFCGLSLLLGSCGTGEKQSPVLPANTFASLSLTSTTAEETKDYVFNTLNNCTFDPNTGAFDASFAGANNATLGLKIRGFTRSDKVYTCKQSTDNQGYPDVGSYIETCGVVLSVPSTKVASTINSYSTYRKDTTIQSFKYAGACTISIDFVDPKTVNGTLNCLDMVQTQLNGGPRNPIDEKTTAGLAGNSLFSCNI